MSVFLIIFSFCRAKAYKSYLTTIPAYKKGYAINYRVKDIISRPSPGIGSSGKISYELLLEGPTETLENDVIIYMKPASRSAVCSVIHNPELDKYFKHDGIRTVLCSYAMQAATPPWLGYTVINNMPYIVDQFTPHAEDLEWKDISDLNEILELVTYLGQATGKIALFEQVNRRN